MSDKAEKVLAAAMLVLLLAGLLPVMYLGRYNHPTGDDFNCSADTRLVWEDTGSLAKTMAEAVKGVGRLYQEWQGTYSAVFLMFLSPNIFGDWFYQFVTAGILLLLTGSIFYLLKPLVCRVLKASAALWLILSAGLSLLCVETVPSQGETFFWYNGSMYYTVYFALSLFFLGILTRFLLAGRIWHIVMLDLLAVFLAGGNYVSLLPCFLFLVLTTAVLVFQKNRKAWHTGTATLLLLAGFLVSAAAPGNQLRQSGLWKIPAWKAIIKSLIQGVRYMGAWTGIWWILTAIVITPVLWKYLKRSACRFPCPILVLVLLYGIFCSMSCPTFYTMNSTGPARVVAIVYYAFVLFSFAGYAYLLGYLQRKWREYREGGASGKIRNLDAVAKAGKVMAAVCVLALVLVQTGTGNMKACTTVKAVALLASGEARAYDLEYRQRIAVLEDDSVKEVVLPPFENQPDMLFVGDISDDPASSANQKMAQYYRKESVIVEYP